MTAPAAGAGVREVWTDFHNHMIPGVDDGAADAEESRRAVRALAAQGVRRLVATPHVDGSVTVAPSALDRRLAELDDGWRRLQDAVGDGDVSLGRGAEIRLDVPDPNLSDDRLRLDGGPAVLVEFPYLRVPPRSAEVLRSIVTRGYRPVLAHPERYDGAEDLAVVRSWIDAGVCMQVNAGSLWGEFGGPAQRRARRMLAEGLVHCLASDYHAHGDPPLARARALVEGAGGDAALRRLFVDNPSRILRGESPVAVRLRFGRGPLGTLKRLLGR